MDDVGKLIAYGFAGASVAFLGALIGALIGGQTEFAAAIIRKPMEWMPVPVGAGAILGIAVGVIRE